MKKLMGKQTTYISNVQSLGNKTTDGNVELLSSKMNDFFVSVSEQLHRLDRNNDAFYVDGQLPNEYDCHRCSHHLTRPKKGQDKQSYLT